MKPRHTYECRECGSIEDRLVKWNEDEVRCQECGGVADRIYQLDTRSRHQQFSEPIVLWRYEDGKLGVAAHTRARTPKNAQRIEINNAHEYRTYVKELNAQHRSEDERREERYLQEVERFLGHGDRELARLAAQETDPMAKDLYRYALEQTYDRPRTFREWYAEVME